MSVGRRHTADLTRAVVLAAGRGTRMRVASTHVLLDREQERAADAGLKALVPFHGQPFLAYVLTSLAYAGYTDVCIVVAPGADPIREHFERNPARRLRLHSAVQDEPLGSAHALLAAESFSDGADIAVINSDNYYPEDALRALRAIDGNGLIGFRRNGLLSGNIDEARIAAYAIIDIDEDCSLIGITEKPDREQLAAAGGDPLISMTCWRLRPSIFDTIRSTAPSPRGELEIPDAVRLLSRRERFEVVEMDARVLDLSRREDIPRVGALLRGTPVEP